MAIRIVGVDLPQNKRGEVALTYVYGIGRSSSAKTVSYTHLSSSMQVPVLKKIVINQGLGMAVADKKIIEVAINEMTAITGQKAVATRCV